MAGELKRLPDGKLLRSSIPLSRNLDCCCLIVPEFPIAISIVNYRKRPYPAFEVILNGVTLAQPNVDVEGVCGGGYYVNVGPRPAYCGLIATDLDPPFDPISFSCCGPEAGDSLVAPVHCPPRGTTCAAIQLDIAEADKQSVVIPCATNACGDCGGDLVRGFITTVYGPGLNTLEVNQLDYPTSNDDCWPAYDGTVEVMGLELDGDEWVGTAYQLRSSWGYGPNVFFF